MHRTLGPGLLESAYQACLIAELLHAGLRVDVDVQVPIIYRGLTLECGVYFGRSLRLIAARTPGPVHGFDSFEGLPEAWSASEGAGADHGAGIEIAVLGRVDGVGENL